MPLRGGFLRPKGGNFETHSREFGDPLRGIVRPTRGNWETYSREFGDPMGVEGGLGGGSMWIEGGASLYSMYEIFDPGRTGTAMLSMNPERFSEATSRLIVERLTWSSRASPFQSGRTVRVAGSMRRSSAASICSPRSNGNDGGRPLGAPVALCGFLTISKPLQY